MAHAQGQVKVTEIDWYFEKFSPLYYKVDYYDIEDWTLYDNPPPPPVHLIAPFPESAILTTDFGNLKTKWIIRLKSTKEGNEERWGFELELVDSEAKQKAGKMGRNTNVAVDVEVNSQLTFLDTKGNRTGFSTGEYTHKFTPENRICPLGWSNALPGGNDGWNIVNKQGKLIFQDGTLRVRVRLEYCGSSLVPQTDRTLVTSHVTRLALLADMQKLLESGQGSDIIIKSGSTTFQAHKLILSLRSPVFEAMLNSDMVESKSGVIKIDDLEPAVVKHLLNYIYSSKLDMTEMKHEEIVGLIQASEKYQLQTLKDFCFDTFFTNLSDDNCGELAVLSQLFCARDDQKAEVHSYISGRWSILSAKAEFQEWVKKCPAAFLKP